MNKNSPIDYQQKRQQLIEEGFCIVENILPAEFVDRLRLVTDQMLEQQSEDDARRQRSTGSMIPVTRDPRLVHLIAHPGALSALRTLGFEDIKFQSGYIISKPPKGPRLFWHYDWGYWAHGISYEAVPAQLFLMYYLTDTSRENGCLRVIPRSHLQENPLHRELIAAHSQKLTEANDLNRIEFQLRPDEIDVQIKAGDLLIGDSRILHAAHSNESASRRTLITLWFHPDFRELPEELRAAFVKRCDPLPADWPEEVRRRYESVVIRYQGSVAPAEFSRERIGASANGQPQVA